MKEKIIQACLIITAIQAIIIPIIGLPIFLIDTIFFGEVIQDTLTKHTGGNSATGFLKFGLIYFSPLILCFILLNLPSNQRDTNNFNMKIKRIVLLDIKKKDNGYEYLYAIYGKSFFKPKIMKHIFRSKLPHFWWTEIVKVLQNMQIYFEDFEKDKEVDIKIGKISLHDFSKSEMELYGKNPSEWSDSLDKAVQTALEFSKEYDEKHGQPDLTGTGLWSDFDPNKEW